MRRHGLPSGIAVLLALLFALLAPPPALAAGAPTPPAGASVPVVAEPPLVSLVTFGPGDLYWERFGHNALLLRDPHSGSAVAFNYGVFDFAEANFLLNFARGIMRYRISADRWVSDLSIYQAEGRWVEEQPLNLTLEQRQAISDFLMWNLRPENRRYPYDYFRSNCSTRVRDAIDRVLGGALKAQLQTRMTTATYRSEVLRLMAPDTLLMLGMDFGLGPAADRPLSEWDDSFIPMNLRHFVAHAQIAAPNGEVQPLAQREREWLPARIPDPPSAAPDLQWPFTLAGVAYAVLLLMLFRARRHSLARLWFSVLAVLFELICGLAGSIVALMWGCTEHWGAWRNENLLLANPLCLLLLGAWFGSAWRAWQPSRFARRLGVLLAVSACSALLWRVIGAYQHNLAWIALLLPTRLMLARVVTRRATVAEPRTA